MAIALIVKRCLFMLSHKNFGYYSYASIQPYLIKRQVILVGLSRLMRIPERVTFRFYVVVKNPLLK